MFEKKSREIRETNVANNDQHYLSAVKTLLALFFLALLGCSNAYAASLYDIDGYYSAVFPRQPQLTGEFGQGADKYRSYNYTDDENIIVYTATYQAGKRMISPKFVMDSLHAFVKGSSTSVGGSVVSVSNVKVDGHMGAKYTIKYEINRMPVVKYGIVVYSAGHFLSWAIQEVPSFSKISGKAIFNKYVKKFTVK